MTFPHCPDCGDAIWTATYRAQVERSWTVSALLPAPLIDREDEDFGEWDEACCVSCGHTPVGQIAADVEALLRG